MDSRAGRRVPGPACTSCLTDWLDWLEQTRGPEYRQDGEWNLTHLRRLAAEVLPDWLFSPERPLRIITVAGTNGKGSTVAFLMALLKAAGIRAGSWTSPHLQRFNERVCVAGEMLPDAALCPAFAAVAQLEDQAALSWFEFSFLVALKALLEAQVDVLLLEVGLGGRLDAANILDADLAIVTTVDLDHQQLLGDTVEAIALEKAGVYRPGRPAICGMEDPPCSLVRHIEAIGARGLYKGTGFRIEEQGEALVFHGRLPDGTERAITDLPRPGLPWLSLGCALEALLWLWPGVDSDRLRQGVADARLAGRCQRLVVRNSRGALITLVLDVAHNRQSACYLADRLASFYSNNKPGCRRALVAMLRDKDAPAVLGALTGCVDHWYLAGVKSPDRSRSAADLAQILEGQPQPVVCYSAVADALQAALEEADAQDTLLVTGSFFTVAESLAALGPVADRPPVAL